MDQHNHAASHEAQPKPKQTEAMHAGHAMPGAMGDMDHSAHEGHSEHDEHVGQFKTTQW